MGTRTRGRLSFFASRSAGRRRLTMAVTATSLLMSGAVLATPGIAQASCGTHGSGLTSEVNDPQFGDDVLFLNGTIWSKQPPGCLDFNLTYTHDTSGRGYDVYSGFYQSGTNWVEGSNGDHQLSDGNHGDFVLVSNVGTGTKLTVSDDLGDLPSDNVKVDY